jgi:hypothetical protein
LCRDFTAPPASGPVPASPPTSTSVSSSASMKDRLGDHRGGE